MRACCASARARVHGVQVGGGEGLGAVAVGIGLGRAHRPDIDDLLAGGVGGELALRILELLANLRKAGLQETAGIGRGFVAALQIGLDEVGADLIGDARGPRRVGVVEPDADQFGGADRIDVEPPHQVIGGALDPGGAIDLGGDGRGRALLGGTPALEGEGGIGLQVQALHDAFGQGAALQQPVLGLEEFGVLHRRIGLQPLDIDDLRRVAFDLQRGFAAVDRDRQQGDQQPDGHPRQHRAQDQPLPLHRDAQQRQKLGAQAIFRLLAPVEVVAIERKVSPAVGLRQGSGIRQLVQGRLHSHRGCGRTVVEPRREACQGWGIRYTKGAIGAKSRTKRRVFDVATTMVSRG